MINKIIYIYIYIYIYTSEHTGATVSLCSYFLIFKKFKLKSITKI